MMRPVRLFSILLVLSLGVPVIQPAEAQLVDRIKNRVKRDAERRVEERAVAAARRTLDLAEDAIVCAVTDKKCIEDARKQGQEPVVVDEDGKPLSGYEPASSNGGSAGDEPGAGVWAGYDFVPGDNILFFHDFEGTRTGNFPSRLDYVAGNMEVVELGENKTLRVGGESGGTGCIKIPLGQPFPERYTIEYRVRTSDPLARMSVHLFSGAQEPISNCRYVPKPNALLTGYQGAGLEWEGGTATSPTHKELVVDTWADVRIAVDGPYWKMYVNEVRVANVPRFAFPEAASLHLMFGSYRESVFIDDIRVAEGGPRSLYDDLMANGFFVTTGVLFDFGSARLKPESTPTLEEIRQMLDEHSEVHIRIEGHTDHVGSDTSNQQLSEERAASVKRYLVDHGIDAARLEAVGLGESRPRADNSTPEGQAMNRRVEVHLVP